jgi:transposase
MDSLTELYSTAKDEFEIAAEETEKRTVYAPDDRQAAKEALQTLKDAYQKAVRESSPEVAQEVTNRVGQRIRELENAVTAMEESAMED